MNSLGIEMYCQEEKISGANQNHDSRLNMTDECYSTKKKNSHRLSHLTKRLEMICNEGLPDFECTKLSVKPDYFTNQV